MNRSDFTKLSAIDAAGTAVSDTFISFPNLSLSHDLFSVRGSWAAIDEREPSQLVLYFRHFFNPLVSISFANSEGAVAISNRIVPGRLEISTDDASSSAWITLSGDADILIETNNLAVNFAASKPDYDHAQAYNLDGLLSAEEGSWSKSLGDWTVQFVVIEGEGARYQDGTLTVDPKGSKCKIAIRFFDQTPSPLTSLNENRQNLASDWERFRTLMPATMGNGEQALMHAWFSLWYQTGPVTLPNFTVQPIVMSKAKMDRVWSWDHCFNALALGLSSLDTGLEQLLIPFHKQRANGQLPDNIGPYDLEWAGTKPPIHGWALCKLLDRHDIPIKILEVIYPKLVKWTDFWFDDRDPNKNGIPGYITSTPGPGWESGWDNSTVAGGPEETESPELQAYLILQMFALARIAEQLNRAEDASVWTSRANEHLKLFYSNFWIDEKLVTRLNNGASVLSDYTSLQPFLSLVLGEHLEKTVFNAIVDKLEPYLTPFGLASELPSSPHYKANGYWLGPIWAPAMYLIIDGLRRGGKTELAYDLAKRFDRLISTAGGYYENFDPFTGVGYCAKAYTWTSSVHVLLLHEFKLS